MYFMISDSSFLVNKIHYLCLKSHPPVLLSANSFLICIMISSGTSGGLYHFFPYLSIHLVPLYQIYVTICKPTTLIYLIHFLLLMLCFLFVYLDTFYK